MSKAETYIQEHTKNCSNEILRNGNESFTNIPRKGEYNPWLTPDQARRAVEIAREEIYEWLRANLCNYFDAPRSMFDMCLEDLKQAIKDETENL